MQAKYFLIALALCLFFPGRASLYAQSTDALGTYTPYSMFGVGERNLGGTAYNKSMGGIGVGVRDNHFINFLNPAAMATDTLSFMMDVGIRQDNYFSKDNKISSVYNVVNVDHIMAAFPVYKSFAMQVGLMPYSSVGYKFMRLEDRDNYISELGDLTYLNYGSGSIYQASIGGGAAFFNHLSIGARGIFYFGDLKYQSSAVMSSNSLYAPIVTGKEDLVRSFGGQFGFQVFGRLSQTKPIVYTIGATCSLPVDMGGDLTRYAYAYRTNSKADTVYNVVTNGSSLKTPAIFTAGFSVKHIDKWMVGMDFEYANWEKGRMQSTPGVNVALCPSYALRLGLEWTPDRYSVRYFLSRITYRCGAYRERSYMTLNGNNIDATGITLGFSVPVFRYYNSIGFSVDMGQRGSIQDNLVRERYIKFVFNFSLHEMWFIKQRYN